MYHNLLNHLGIMIIEIISNNSIDPIFSNLIPGSTHKTVPPSRNYALWDIAGVWIEGSDGEAHLLPCEKGSDIDYKIIKP